MIPKPGALVFALLLLLFYGCPDDDAIILPPPEPEPLSCVYEFEPNASGDSCVCPEGKIQQDTIICYTLPAGYYYADMANCEWPIGMAFGPRDGSDLADTATARIYSSVSRSFFHSIGIVRPRRSFNDRLGLAPTSVQIFESSTGWDSLAFFSDLPEWAMPREEQEVFIGQVLFFKGKLLGRDTIRGNFYWADRYGPAPDFEDFDTYEWPPFYSCESTFIRRAE